MLIISDTHGNRVDLLGGLRGLDPQVFSRAVDVPFSGDTLRVVGREDFIAMKCFEILKRLWVFEQAREAPLTEVQFRERFATAETECAPFIEHAYEVAEAIAEAGGRPA